MAAASLIASSLHPLNRDCPTLIVAPRLTRGLAFFDGWDSLTPHRVRGDEGLGARGKGQGARGKGLGARG
jgi:hypothetical protein